MFSYSFNAMLTKSISLYYIIYLNIEDFGQQNTVVEIYNELEKVTTWPKLNKLALNVQRTCCIPQLSWHYVK